MNPLDASLTKLFEDRRRVTPQHTNRASQAGIECARRLQWHRTRWQSAALPPVPLQRRFELGKIFEPQIVRLLEDAGVRVEQSQRDLHWPSLQLTGHVDGVVGEGEDRAVLEIKTASRFSFNRIRKSASAARLLEDDRAYVRGYVVQGALYALLLGLKRTWLLFFDKDSGSSHTIEVSLEDPMVLAAAEQALQRFERVNAAISRGEDLAAEPAAYCRDCPFLTACLPDQSFASLRLLDDDDLEELVARHEALKPGAKEYEAIDEVLKERFAEPGENLLGDWIVRVKASTTTRYEVPADVKAPFAKKVQQLRREYLQVQKPDAKAIEEAA